MRAGRHWAEITLEFEFPLFGASFDFTTQVGDSGALLDVDARHFGIRQPQIR